MPPKPKAKGETAGASLSGSENKAEVEHGTEAEAGAAATEGAAVEAKSGKAAAVKLKDLVDRVCAASDLKKKDAKAAVEATLVQIGAALARGESLNLQGLGYVRIVRKATAQTPVMTLKLRLADAGKAKATTVEED